jgi:hypothetical protein
MARGESKHIIAFWVRGEKWYDCVPFGWILAQRTDGRNAAYADGLAKLLNALGITSKAPAVAFPQQTPPQELSETLLRQHAEVKELPNIVPVGARFGAMERDMRLETSTRHMIYVQNIGGHVASRIYAVLFPSVMYFNHQGMSQGNPPLWGAYWQGYSRGSLRPGERGFTVLEQSQRPMMGDLRVAPQFTLYAPIQPSPEERHAGTHFYSARLTITYASSASGIGPNFVTIFDLDADHLAQNRKDIWDQILLPTEVEKDLVGVVYDWEQKQQPPI